jgi:hypothetical protein
LDEIWSALKRHLTSQLGSGPVQAE